MDAATLDRPLVLETCLFERRKLRFAKLWAVHDQAGSTLDSPTALQERARNRIKGPPQLDKDGLHLRPNLPDPHQHLF